MRDRATIAAAESARSDENQAVVRFLVREKKKFEAAADDAKLPGESKQRCAVRASLLATLIEQISRGDHRLPE